MKSTSFIFNLLIPIDGFNLDFIKIQNRSDEHQIGHAKKKNNS